MRLRAVQRSVQCGAVHGVFGREQYPSGAILHWDADTDAFAEQTGGPHTFNSSILSPQYQRNADGSYSDVGAKPAVDVFGGKKFLRSCGAVQNLFTNSIFEGAVGGTPGTAPTGWTDGYTTGGLALNSDGSITFTCTAAQRDIRQTIAVSANTKYMYSLSVLFDGVINIRQAIFWGAIPSGTITSFELDDVAALGDVVPTAGLHNVAVLFLVGTTAGNIGVRAGCGAFGALGTNVTGTVTISNPQLTATAYPQPYVPTTAAGPVTQPASNATTTNGVWFALPDGSPLWQALDGQADGVELYSGQAPTPVNTGTVTQSGDDWIITGNGPASGGRVASGAGYPELFPAGYRRLVRVKLKSLSGTWAIRAYDSSFVLLASKDGNTSFDAYLDCPANAYYYYFGVNGSMTVDTFSVQRIQPQPLTLATRVRMGVGSGDLPDNTGANSVAIANNAAFLWARNVSGTRYAAASNDGTLTALSPAVSWSRNAVLRKTIQVNAAGTQYRVGYMIEGTHTEIQWGSWVNYDGSMNPSTLYRLMLGYNNAYPMWFNKITAWKKQATDAEILEAMAA